MRFATWFDRNAPLVAAVAFITLMGTAKLLEAFGAPPSIAITRAFCCATLVFVGPPFGWALLRHMRKSA